MAVRTQKAGDIHTGVAYDREQQLAVSSINSPRITDLWPPRRQADERFRLDDTGADSTS